MKEPKENTSSSYNPWFFITIGQKIQLLASGIVNLIFVPDFDMPDNEAGELMRRYLAHQSWFDSLSAKWTGTSFISKAAWIAGTASACALIGVILGSPLILALSALTLSLVVHAFLVAHETHRLKGAKLFVAEHIDLTKVLTDSQVQLDEANQALDLAVETVETKDKELAQKLLGLKAQQQRLEQANDKLDVQVDEVEAETGRLVSQENLVTQAVTDWGDEINKGTQAVCSASEQVNTIEQSITKFSKTVIDAKKSQKDFSNAVSEFSVFVRTEPKVDACYSPGMQKFLDNEAEYDRIISKITQVR